MTYMGHIGKVTLINRGNECDVEWQMDYLSLSNEIDTYYCSNNFSFEDKSWYLAIWPNGREHWKTAGFVGLRLRRESSSGPSINVEFCFALENVNGQKDLEGHKTEGFEGASGHGILRFISKSTFEKRKSEFLASGMLTVVCTLKRITATGSAECSYCKGTFDAEIIPSHERKCRVKCPECSDVVLHQYWNEHECEISRAEGKDCISACKILQDFKVLFLNQTYSDVVIKVSEQEFTADRNILAARSTVFEAAFRNDMKEKATGIIEIEDCDPNTFKDFLCFLYCGDQETISEKNVFSLFVTADKYNVEDLRVKCIEFIKENLSVDTFCDAFILALRFSENELIQRGTDFFAKNMQKIIVTDKWESFLTENPKQSNKLLIKSLVTDKKSNG